MQSSALTKSTTADIQKSLLDKTASKKSCSERLWDKLLSSPNLLSYQSTNNKCREFLSACYTSSVLLTETAIATGLADLTIFPSFYVFNPIFLGASWGGALLSLPLAAYFAYADAQSHTVTSEQICSSELSIELAAAKEEASPKSFDIDLEKGEQKPEDLVSLNGKPLGITRSEWNTSIAHLFNDTFKTMNDYLVYIKGAEEILNPYQFIPPAIRTYAVPAIKGVYYAGLFAAGLLGNAQEFKNTVISFAEKRLRLERSRSNSP